MRSRFMHWSSVLFLKKDKQNLFEKLPSNLEIAKLSVSYSNYFFNLYFNFCLVQKYSKYWRGVILSTFPDSSFP